MEADIHKEGLDLVLVYWLSPINQNQRKPRLTENAAGPASIRTVELSAPTRFPEHRPHSAPWPGNHVYRHAIATERLDISGYCRVSPLTI